MQHIKQYRLLVLFMTLLCFGVGLGSYFLMKTSDENFVHIKEYLISFFGVINDISKTTVFKNSLYESIILVLFVFISGFFRVGIVAIGVCVAKKGFIMGFTTASMLKSFGIKGMLINMAYLPSMLIVLPVLIFFCILSVKINTNTTKQRKKLLVNYGMFAIMTITIFCISSFLEAYLTTTFMKLISSSLI